MNECKQLGHAWKCLRCGQAKDGANPNDFWKDVLPQIMEEHTTYRLSEITANADELRRIMAELDELSATYISLYRRLNNLIKQGTYAKKEINGGPGGGTKGVVLKIEDPKQFFGD